MSHINIDYPCHSDPQQTTEKVTQLLDKLQQKYQVGYSFDNPQQCQLNGSGINGTVQICDHNINIQVKLSLMMMAFKPLIESEIKQQLIKTFG